MKMLILTALIFAGATARADYTRGYERRDGTYVQGYHHTHENANPYDNYSSRGNTNPYTGQAGTVAPPPESNPYVNPYGSGYSGSHF